VIQYRVPFSPDRPGSPYKARVQFVRSIIGEGTGGTLYTTPEASLAIAFDAASLADARRELARRDPAAGSPARAGSHPVALRHGRLPRRVARVGAPPRGTGPGLVG
jgi:hypothetical protein